SSRSRAMHSTPAESGPSLRRPPASCAQCLFARHFLSIPKRQLLRAQARLDRTIREPAGEGRIPDAWRQASCSPYGSDAALLVVIHRYWGVVVAMLRSSLRVASLIHATPNRKAPFATFAIRARPEHRGSLATHVPCS